MELRLKKCPKCGGQHLEFTRYTSSGIFFIYGIRCKHCDHEVRELHTSRALAEYKAKKKWNYLAEQRSLKEEVNTLKEYVIANAEGGKECC